MKGNNHVADFKHVLKRGVRKTWVEGHGQSGVCFSVTYDRIIALLRKEGAIKDASVEFVDKIIVDNHGVTVFLGKE